MRKLRHLASFFLLSCVSAWAGTYTAATCSQADVNAVINGPTHTAVAGDVIIIPGGTCTWVSGITFSVGITLQGTGTPNNLPSQFGAGPTSTVITLNTGSSAAPFTATSIPQGQTLRISQIDFEPYTGSSGLYSPISAQGTCNSGGCPNIRIDNNKFGITNQWTESAYGAQSTSMLRIDGFFGVVDHNTTNSTVFANPSHSAYLGVGSYGDNSWAQPDSFGTQNNIYFENNILNVGEDVTDCEFYATNGSVCGVRQVGRFNQINVSPGLYYAFGGHGLDTLGRSQGMREMEVYGNVITCSGSGGCGELATFRAGGTGIILGNTFVANYPVTGAYFSNIFDTTIYRNVYGATNNWSYCGGSSPYDTNDGTVYYSGTLTSGTSDPNGGPAVIQDTTQSWSTNQLAPAGSPYSIYDSTKGIWAEIASNTSNTATTQYPISESTWYGGGSSGFQSGDSYQILRATVCADQGGRGAGGYVSGSTPSPASPLNQALDPIIEVADICTLGSDSACHVNNGESNNDHNRLIANRDFYSGFFEATQTSSTSPFNGSSGVGHGTLANRPTSCTTGVAYWASDQGSWNTSGNGFGQGVLYKCTSTNTWTTYYTPYTYPHPLDSSGTTYTWTPTIVGSGSLSGSNCGSGSYSSGTTIGACTAVPGTGYSFTGWSSVSGSAACSGSTNPCPSFSITANSAATATFTANSTGAPPQLLLAIRSEHRNGSTCDGVSNSALVFHTSLKKMML